MSGAQDLPCSPPRMICAMLKCAKASSGFSSSCRRSNAVVRSNLPRFSASDGFEWASQGDGDHFFYPDAGIPDGNYNLGPNPFTNQQWHHLAVTIDFDASQTNIYVDGTPMTFSYEGVPSSWNDLTSSDDWLWGGNPDRSSRYFDGVFDEIRVAEEDCCDSQKKRQ